MGTHRNIAALHLHLWLWRPGPVGADQKILHRRRRIETRRKRKWRGQRKRKWCGQRRR